MTEKGGMKELLISGDLIKKTIIGPSAIENQPSKNSTVYCIFHKL